MSNTSTNIIQPKFKDRIQRTSYKASEKLAIINEAKKFNILAVWVRDKEKFSNAISTSRHVGAGKILAYSAAEEELLKWINELCLVEIAVTAGAIKLQMVTILAITCANDYSDASNKFHTS
ncbi:7625_t:CDS:2 [Ambispora leptoticha]|uniref:7625_t:CDS:1 n=1 Tax=Ambispora leptoticha TaxID=144679 RepID=A0A9N9CTS8_9GLOM|nr:7625_t:CDS:2 [Ambispora leptoticha]